MRLKKYIKSLGFRWMDISIIPFFVFTILLILKDVNLMWVDGGLNLSQPIWVFVLYFALGLISLFLFSLSEYRRIPRSSLIPLILVIVLFVFSAISIYSNPNSISLTLFDMENNPFEIAVNISNHIKFIHFGAFLFFILALYIWVFIMPKKFKNASIISLICTLFYGLSLFVIIYSLINDNYVLFFEKLFGNFEDYVFIKNYIPQSIFGNPNVYAFFLEIGLFLSLINHSIKRRKICYLFLIIYYALLILTLCKTGILFATILLLLYLIYLFFYSILKHETNTIITTSVILLCILATVLLVLKIYLFNASIKDKIDYTVSQISTLTGRNLIWNIAKQLISPKLFYGNGHGIYNLILSEGTSYIDINNEHFISTHNSFLAILGEGGIVYLLAYVALIIYACVLIAKLFKKSFETSVALLFGLLLFLSHSIFEDIYYYVELIVVFIAISYNVYKHQNDEVKELPVNKEAQA